MLLKAWMTTLLRNHQTCSPLLPWLNLARTLLSIKWQFKHQMGPPPEIYFQPSKCSFHLAWMLSYPFKHKMLNFALYAPFFFCQHILHFVACTRSNICTVQKKIKLKSLTSSPLFSFEGSVTTRVSLSAVAHCSSISKDGFSLTWQKVVLLIRVWRYRIHSDNNEWLWNINQAFSVVVSSKSNWQMTTCQYEA